MRIDLNCDLGEGAGHDAELMPLITSANIACGAHAGDEATMRATVESARRHRVGIGAHPGFADREHFGRRELSLPAAGVTTLVRTQIAALHRFATPRHVKPHGGLYNLAAHDRATAEAVAAAVASEDRGLILFALAGSELVLAGRAHGLRVAEEVFADRAYRADGTLVPRAQPGAVIEDVDEAVARAVRMIRAGRVRAIDGTELALRADTICVHGDGPNAVAIARRLRAGLRAAGVEIVAV